MPVVIDQYGENAVYFRKHIAVMPDVHLGKDRPSVA